MNDGRNVTDEFKGVAGSDIITILDERGISLEIAIENVERDFNMGTIIRSANAFGVRHVHIIGRKQWNKRGAMMTDKYLHVHYYQSIDDFRSQVGERPLIAIDNIPGSTSIITTKLPKNSIFLFGSESNGLSEQAIAASDKVVQIDQKGSTRSLNVGVAAGIAMFEWVRQFTNY